MSADPSMLTCGASTTGMQRFHDAAMSLRPYVTDKVDELGGMARYETMYGIFMMPIIAATGGGAGIKILEIGLGCDYNRGNAGLGKTHAKSARLWRKVMPKAELWEAEYDGNCVAKMSHLWSDLNIHTLVGDQGNSSVLDSWIRRSGGAYNAVIDDGSHRNSDMLTSFHKLWPHVLPGGFYFIEDLQVGRHAAWDPTDGEAVMSDVLQAWIEQLLISDRYGKSAGCYSRLKRPPAGRERCPAASAAPHLRAQQMRARHPLPAEVAFVFCQSYACVVGKKAMWPAAAAGT